MAKPRHSKPKSIAATVQALKKPQTVAEVTFKVGDLVRKVGGDYTFQGVVVAVFRKLSGVIRYVVEDDRGVLHVYNGSILQSVLVPVE